MFNGMKFQNATAPLVEQYFARILAKKLGYSEPMENFYDIDYQIFSVIDAKINQLETERAKSGSKR